MIRRLDQSLNLMQEIFDALPESDRIEVSHDQGIRLIEILSRVRGMELAEEETGYPSKGSVADLYDELIVTGAPLVASLLTVAVAAITRAAKDN